MGKGFDNRWYIGSDTILNLSSDGLGNIIVQDSNQKYRLLDSGTTITNHNGWVEISMGLWLLLVLIQL